MLPARLVQAVQGTGARPNVEALQYPVSVRRARASQTRHFGRIATLRPPGASPPPRNAAGARPRARRAWAHVGGYELETESRNAPEGVAERVRGGEGVRVSARLLQRVRQPGVVVAGGGASGGLVRHISSSRCHDRPRLAYSSGSSPPSSRLRCSGGSSRQQLLGKAEAAPKGW